MSWELHVHVLAHCEISPICSIRVMAKDCLTKYKFRICLGPDQILVVARRWWFMLQGWEWGEEEVMLASKHPPTDFSWLTWCALNDIFDRSDTRSWNSLETKQHLILALAKLEIWKYTFYCILEFLIGKNEITCLIVNTCCCFCQNCSKCRANHILYW